MKQKVKVYFFCVFLLLLLIPVLTGCKKPAPQTESTAPRIGVLDLDKTMRAHPRFNEYDKLSQEIAQVQAEASRSNSGGTVTATGQATNLAGQSAAGYQQVLEQQISAQLAQKHNELGQVLQAKIAAESQRINEQMADYARELDKTYQAEILSAQLKIQTVQMTPEERETAKQRIDSLQAERTQKLQERQQALEQEAKTKIDQEQKNIEEQFRQYQAKLTTEANGQMSEKMQDMQTRRAEMEAGVSLSSATQKNAAGLKVLQEQKEQLRQIMLKDVKDAAARIAAKENLEVVIVNYQQNIQGIDVTDAVMAEIKK